jgi:hypothetical protein
MTEKELSRTTEQAPTLLAVKLGQRKLRPASIAPRLIPMRPNPSPDPAIESMEELTNVGAFVILAPTPQSAPWFSEVCSVWCAAVPGP